MALRPPPGDLGGDRRAIVARAVRATLEGDSSVVADLFTSDVHATMPTCVWSRPGLAVEIEDRAGAFSHVRLRVTNAQTAASDVWLEWTASVVHVGPFAIDDTVIAPTGRRAQLHGVTVAEFDGDRMRGFRQYWDCAALLVDRAAADRPSPP